MKEKLGVAFIIAVATLCLFGCGKELPEEDMVMQPYLIETRS